MSLHIFTKRLELHEPIERVFQHFTDTDQMACSFPPSLKLQILQRTSRHMNQGSTIEFQAYLWRIPFRWKFYVHSFSINQQIAYLSDSSRFVSWEYDCYFESLSSNQTRITGCILYRFSFGFLGNLLNRICIHPLLERMFTYHHTSLLSIFQASQNSSTNPPKNHSHDKTSSKS